MSEHRTAGSRAFGLRIHEGPGVAQVSERENGVSPCPGASASGQAPGDLASRSAIHDLVVEFYREIILDEVLDPVFSEVAEVDWNEHIPKLVDYWCQVLLRTGDYTGPIMAAHRELHSVGPIRAEHCDRWYALWVQSVDGSWSGPVADRAKEHAASVMAGMAKHIFCVPWTASGLCR